ncbi:MAG: metallophosphoesterase [Hespellia sp.]|nr:metallophosphoesterase [Hespellia sp.]
MDVEKTRKYKEIREHAKHVENSAAGWNQVEVTFNSEPVAFSVEIRNLSSKGEDHIYNLQYFFVFVDRVQKKRKLKNLKEIDKFYLFISCNSDDSYRISAFLKAQNMFRLDIDIVLDGKKGYYNQLYQESNVGSGKIMPLFHVENTEHCTADIIAYKDLMKKDDFLYEQLQKMQEIIELENEDINYNREAIVSKSSLQLMKVFSITQIVELLKNVKGDRKTKFSVKTKQQYRSQIIAYIKNQLKYMNFLSQLIWMYQLKYINENRELVEVLANGEIHLNQGIFECTMWDSIAYAEGVLQLIENSCQHSNGKSAYISMRVRQVGLNAVDSELLSVAEKRVQLKKKFSLHNGHSPLEEGVSFYLEFMLIDDMLNVETGGFSGVADKADIAPEEIHKLFLGSEEDDEAEGREERILHHYGLPLFRRIIKMNGGTFLFSSGKKKNKQDILDSVVFCDASGIKCEREEYQSIKIKNRTWIPDGCTVFDILLPITDRKKEVSSSQYMDTDFFGADIIRKGWLDYKEYDIAFDKIIPEDLCKQRNILWEQSDKIEYVKKIEKNLIVALDGKEQALWYIKIEKCSLSLLELFVKAIYALAFHERRTENMRFFAISFDNNLIMAEFLRLASVFYDREGVREWSKNIQIALCGKNEETMLPEIKCVLAGKNIRSVYNTLLMYAYYNSEASLQLMNQAYYLTRTEEEKKDDKDIETIFPFDMILKCESENYFFSRIRAILEHDVQEEGMGCKISNAHIRLGSKLHITDFYEAELLFHNIANVYKFSLCLADKIYRTYHQETGLEIPERLVLVGYENYSAILILQLKQLLDDLKFKNVFYIIYKSDEVLDDTTISDLTLEKTNYISVLPVATTLSTVYKIHNVVERKYKSVLSDEFQWEDYALIIVGNSRPDSNKLQEAYWKENRKEQNVALRIEKNEESSKECIVKYILMLKTTWYKPEDCELCNVSQNSRLKMRPLSFVDKTSTIPNMIFPKRNSDFKGISYFIRDDKNNSKKLEKIQECITYGHIVYGDNHFQFYIDFPHYYRKLQKEQSLLNKWFADEKKLLQENNDVLNFNIVVSPLSYSEPLFLKGIMDNVFGNAARLLYIPINESYKEDVRSKFNYFTKEYKSMYEQDVNTKINIYYVDYSIISGHTLYRARNLIRMLLEESGVSYKNNVTFFSKVYVLLNRSSFDTVNSFVENPFLNYRVFATLAINSFNTLENSCPICEQANIYANIANNSATNAIYWKYKKLAEKHSKKSSSEYRMWQRNTIFKSSSYNQKLQKNLYYKENKEYDLKKEYLRIFDELYNKKENLDFKIVEAYNDRISNQSLDDIFTGNNKNNAEKLIETDIEKKAYLRMISTHNAMIAQEKIYDKSYICNNVDPRIIQDDNMIARSVNGIVQVLEKDVISIEGTITEKRERLISYIKVFSRGYLGKISFIRSAMYLILQEMFDQFLKYWNYRNEEEKENYVYDSKIAESLKDIGDFFKVDKSGDFLEVYQLYATIAKRLCDMQSNKIFEFQNFMKIKNFISNLREQYIKWVEELIEKAKEAENSNERKEIEKIILNPFPTAEQFNFDYMNLLKWAVMSGQEDNKAFRLKGLYEKILLENQKSVDIELNNFELDKVLQLENTRIICTGIKRMNELASENMSIEYAEKLVEKTKKSCNRSDPAYPYDYLLQNPMSDFFRFMCEGATVSEEILTKQQAAMLLLYRKIERLQRNVNELSTKKTYVAEYNEMCDYMSLVANGRKCYLIHARNDENIILAHSGDIVEDKEADINADIHTLTNLAFESLPSGISIDATITNDDIFWIIKLLVNKNEHIDYKQRVYIVFKQKNDGCLSEEEMSVARGILFLRPQIQILLERDLYAIHHFKSNYEDVEKNENENVCRILHITDLHVAEYNAEAIKDQIKATFFGKSDNGATATEQLYYDLIVITGDVAQGSGTAKDMELNYQKAAEVIKTLVKQIWTDKDTKMIKSDWQKRVIIIPGNHDYASMNELEVVHRNRMTYNGSPTKYDGSTMIKFSYYIDFLCELLDLNMSEVIRKNLNDYRVYEKLKVRFVTLNTVTEVSALRNNKMQLDENYIKSLPTVTKGDEYTNIYLMHHTPLYMNNYNNDKYWEKDITKEMQEVFGSIIEMIVEYYSPESNKKIVDVNNYFEQKKIQRILEVMRKQCRKSSLYSDVMYLKQHWQDQTNERCIHIIMEYVVNKKMQERDRAEFRRRLKSANNKIHIDIILGGHTHQKRKNKENDCFEEMKFYDEEKSATRLNYGILEITVEGDGSVKREYNFSLNESIDIEDIKGNTWREDD